MSKLTFQNDTGKNNCHKEKSWVEHSDPVVVASTSDKIRWATETLR